jgi:hypothetical protein
MGRTQRSALPSELPCVHADSHARHCDDTCDTDELVADWSYRTQTRSFAAVLFRRIATRSRKDAAGVTREIFQLLQPAQREAIRSKLLECLGSESLSQVRNKIGDAVAEVARQYTEDSTSALPHESSRSCYHSPKPLLASTVHLLRLLRPLVWVLFSLAEL